ncbi:MAG: site-2 protease family protein [Candidatus Bathyarchaeota archaeon]|nr:MAG: site-2 protease family protein [Candidatus Bathyarchaeota archaeon]
MSSNDSSAPQPAESVPFEELRNIVESEFHVEESFVEYGAPTFYIRLQEDSKEAFLRLMGRLQPVGLVPVLRRRDAKIFLQVGPKPPTKSSRKLINIALFFATLATVLFAGYLQSIVFYFDLGITSQLQYLVGAVMFAGAIMAILGSHEMGHKIAADRQGVDATYPYFIPGPPPIGTFGALIQQKSLPPNRDALFDLGSAGPIVGFIVAIAVTLIGIPLSSYTWISEGAPTLPISPLFLFIMQNIHPLEGPPPPPGNGANILAISPHPVAFAGWIGMIVTVLNLIPVGMFDGGHIAETFLGKKVRAIISYLAIAVFFILGFFVWDAFLMWAIIAIFFSFMRHPGPLDSVSKVTSWRKLAALGMVAVFFLCFPFII